MGNANDPRRLATAAHELGHFLAWHEGGLKVLSVQVEGYGDQARGRVKIRSLLLPRDEHLLRAYLVGLVAGAVVERRWCRERQMAYHPHTAEGDRRAYRSVRKHPLVAAIPLRDLLSEARRVARSKWSQIRRMAPMLAARGQW